MNEDVLTTAARDYLKSKSLDDFNERRRAGHKLYEVLFESYMRIDKTHVENRKNFALELEDLREIECKEFQNQLNNLEETA